MGNVAYKQLDIQRETPPTEFFPDGAADVVPVLRFMRTCQNIVMSAAEWKEAEALRAEHLAKALPEAVDARTSGTSYDSAV